MYIVDTDASGGAIGAILSQIQDGEEKVICYGSRVCSSAEQTYDVTRRELLAIIFFLKTFRPYLLGRRFLLRTDHSALQWLRRTPVPIGQQASWLSVLEEFDFQVQHQAGVAHGNADAISRRPPSEQKVNRITRGPIDAVLLPETWNRAVLGDEQRADPDLGWIMNKKQESEEAPTAADTKRMSATVKLLVAQWHQIVLPPPRREALIQMAHQGMTGGTSVSVVPPPKCKGGHTGPTGEKMLDYI